MEGSPWRWPPVSSESGFGSCAARRPAGDGIMERGGWPAPRPEPGPRPQAARLAGLSTCPIHVRVPRHPRAPHRPTRPRVRGEAARCPGAERRPLHDRYDIAKASFHAALLLADRYGVVPAGSALGFGVGPLIVAAPRRLASPEARVLCPGPTTTATLLYRCLHPTARGSTMPSSRTSARRSNGATTTLARRPRGPPHLPRDGLKLVEDLGASFEELARAPVPLGGVVARLDLRTSRRALHGRPARLDRLRRRTPRRRARHDPAVRPGLGEDVSGRTSLYVTEHMVDLGAEGAGPSRCWSRRGARRPRSPRACRRLRIRFN